MYGMRKVLVVDNGKRALDGTLSAELAEMGFASVTAALEATDDILALIPSPAAVVLQMPRRAAWAERKQFLDLADRLRRTLHASDIPVIVMHGTDGPGAHASQVRSELGARIPSRPES
jgi:CheY-like chemotaxis protein